MDPSGTRERPTPGLPGGAFTGPEISSEYRAILDSMVEVVFLTDAFGNWLYLNQAWTTVTGHAVETSLGTNFLDFVHPAEVAATLALFQSVVSGALPHCQHETRYRTASGDYRWIELRASPIYDQAGIMWGNAGTIVDITERKLAQELLTEQNRLLELVARDAPLSAVLGELAVLLAQRTGTIVAVAVLPPQAPEDALPRQSRQQDAGVTVVGHADGSRHDGELSERTADWRDHHPRTQVAIRASSGGVLGTITLEGSAAAMALLDHELVGRGTWLGAIAIERRHAQDQARHQALHDPLTGLPNRTLFTDRLRQAIRSARRRRQRMALLALDLDRFKVINDTLGHHAGDRVLRVIAERIDQALRDSDTVSRTGGDEFVIVLPEVDDVQGAEEVARHVLAAIRQPLELDGLALPLDASIGIAVAQPAGTDPDTLLRRADVAMYRAKRLGGGQAVYDPLVDEERLRGLGLSGELGMAIEEGQLVLHHQPKLNLHTGEVVGVECLVRWEHPLLGTLAPDTFIHLAESNGAIKPLSLWVLRRALADRRIWRMAGADLGLAVNVSAQALGDPEVLDQIVTLLSQERGETRLELEMTESAVLADTAAVSAAMRRLESLGVSFAVDDFGTGYSSLSQLKALPVRSLKIDKSFVSDMTRDERDASIVRSSIALAHDLELEVVAEGVEDPQTLELLRQLHCDFIQGYHVARPMPADQVLGWLECWTRGHARTPR